MTAARQQRKCLILAVLLGLTGAVTQQALAASDDRTIVNSHSGLGISGFDPVAYFVRSTATVGKADLELSRSGVVWRFANEGNRAAFADNPDVYMPRFGGYDPVAIARGTSVPGHPLYWALAGERLYLFYNEAARTAFVADPGRYIETAERKWPEVARTIGR